MVSKAYCLSKERSLGSSEHLPLSFCQKRFFPRCLKARSIDSSEVSLLLIAVILEFRRPIPLRHSYLGHLGCTPHFVLVLAPFLLAFDCNLEAEEYIILVLDRIAILITQSSLLMIGSKAPLDTDCPLTPDFDHLKLLALSILAQTPHALVEDSLGISLHSRFQALQ